MPLTVMQHWQQERDLYDQLYCYVRSLATEEELRRLIRDAGFIPKQRDTLYRTYFLN